jgi:ABC-type polysaccharide/polyol phosphate export permease
MPNRNPYESSSDPPNIHRRVVSRREAVPRLTVLSLTLMFVSIGSAFIFYAWAMRDHGEGAVGKFMLGLMFYFGSEVIAVVLATAGFRIRNYLTAVVICLHLLLIAGPITFFSVTQPESVRNILELLWSIVYQHQ